MRNVITYFFRGTLPNHSTISPQSLLLNFSRGHFDRLYGHTSLLYRNLTLDNLIILLKTTHILPHVTHFGELPIVLFVAVVEGLCWDRLVIFRDVLFREDDVGEVQLPGIEDALGLLLEGVCDEGGVDHYGVFLLVVDCEEDVVVHLK